MKNMVEKKKLTYSICKKHWIFYFHFWFKITVLCRTWPTNVLTNCFFFMKLLKTLTEFITLSIERTITIYLYIFKTKTIKTQRSNQNYLWFTWWINIWTPIFTIIRILYNIFSDKFISKWTSHGSNFTCSAFVAQING